MQYMDVDAVDFQVVRVNVGRASGVTHGDTHFGFSSRMDRTDGTSGQVPHPLSILKIMLLPYMYHHCKDNIGYMHCSSTTVVVCLHLAFVYQITSW
jgi:hypothetical protein